MQKSIDGSLVKSKVKHVQGNETRAEASIRHHSSKSTNSEVNKRTSLSSMPGLKRSVVQILFPHCLSLCSLFASYTLVSMFMTLVLCTSLEGLLQLLQSPRAIHLRHHCKSYPPKSFFTVCLCLYWKRYVQEIAMHFSAEWTRHGLSPPYGFLHYCRPIDQISDPSKTAKPIKEDEDSHSTTSYGFWGHFVIIFWILFNFLWHWPFFIFRSSFPLAKMFMKAFFIYIYVIRSATPRQRNSCSGFSSRLEERAEKRKEVVAGTLHPIDVSIANVRY